MVRPAFFMDALPALLTSFLLRAERRRQQARAVAETDAGVIAPAVADRKRLLHCGTGHDELVSFDANRRRPGDAISPANGGPCARLVDDETAIGVLERDLDRVADDLVTDRHRSGVSDRLAVDCRSRPQGQTL